MGYYHDRHEPASEVASAFIKKTDSGVGSRVADGGRRKTPMPGRPRKKSSGLDKLVISIAMAREYQT